MNNNMDASTNKYDSEDARGTISPLPPVLTQGLAAVTALALLSLLSTVTLFTYLSYKLVVWHLRPPREKPSAAQPPAFELSPPISDLDGFLVPEEHLCPQKPDYWQQPPAKETFLERLRREPPNQFLILIYNLLLADIQQALAFFLNVAWLGRDAVQVGTATCWAQGWFVSTGDLASSVFISAIAVHTYLGVVKEYRLPTRMFYTGIAVLWAFVYGTAVLGVIITSDGKDTGGLYVRAGAWCWINSAYQSLRMSLHYLWIFLSLTLTAVIYTTIFIKLHRARGIVDRHHELQRNGRRTSATNTILSGVGEHYPNPDPNTLLSQSLSQQLPLSPRSAMTDTSMKRLPPIPSSARHPTFLVYPVIYVLCTAPLAAGRIASLAGHEVSLAFFCFAGSMIASAGWLDVFLYSTTRRSIVFSGEAPPSQDTGLETFAFMRTPVGRRFGNMVYVSGGEPEGSDRGKRWARWNEKVMASARLKTLTGRGGIFHLGHKNTSKETLTSLRGFGMGGGEVMGMAIQCETTTKVIIEPAAAVGRKGSVASLSTNGPNSG